MIKLTQFKRYDLCYFKSRTCLLQLLLAGTLQIMNITYYFQAYIPSIKLLVTSHVMLSTSEKTTIRSVGAKRIQKYVQIPILESILKIAVGYDVRESEQLRKKSDVHHYIECIVS